MTRPERYAALVCVLCLIAAVLVGCATKPEPLPEVLPHYPCERVEKGRTVYYACSDQEWLTQVILRGKQ